MPMAKPNESHPVPTSDSGAPVDLSPLRNFRFDAPAAVVVFLVALPLCLGIALASGAPLFSGLIAGIVGGTVIAFLGGSPLAVSGPAAGLTVIVMSAIDDLGGWEPFLLAVVLAGILQFVLGVVRAGIVSYYFPSTVIKGLLAAIGVILILKQIPHSVGWDKDPEGDLQFLQPDGHNTFSEIFYAFEHVHIGAAIIAVLGLAILITLQRKPTLIRTKWLPGPLLVVLMGIGVNEFFAAVAPSLANTGELLVAIPVLHDVGMRELISFPDFSRIADPAVYQTAVTLAIVASIETLLCVEAIDKLDPFKRKSDTNKELRAQGIGNLVCGLIGGLPITAVIVRGSANIQSGARSQMSSFLHGVLLLLAVVAIPIVLNRIPLAALAAVLLHIGYKLAPLSLFKSMWARGRVEFLPFITTVVAILLTDLLKGVLIGFATGVFFILRANLKTPYYLHRRESHEEEHPSGRRTHIHLELSENVTFLNKASVAKALSEIPDGAVVDIDASHSMHINRDVLEVIHEFAVGARYRGIACTLVDVPSADATSGDLEGRKPVEESLAPNQPRARQPHARTLAAGETSTPDE